MYTQALKCACTPYVTPNATEIKTQSVHNGMS